MDLKPHLSRDGKITSTDQGWRLAISSGPSGRYRLSQLDDYLGFSRKAYPRQPPLTISLRARISSRTAPGTWGFGLWNDPFGFSLGPGEDFLHLPALPNAIWFFHASPKNHLSFRNDKPGHGLLAQVFHSPRFDPALIPAGLALPFSGKTSRRLLSHVIAEDAIDLSVDTTEWHAYRFRWDFSRSTFWVDEKLVLESPISPASPLGLVIWIDNQYAAFTPDGRLKWGLEENLQSAWLEIGDVEVSGIDEHGELKVRA
jgi:hypothetical protein